MVVRGFSGDCALHEEKLVKKTKEMFAVEFSVFARPEECFVRNMSRTGTSAKHYGLKSTSISSCSLQ